MAKSAACAICLLLLISGSVDVSGLSRGQNWGAGGSRWSDEKCPESLRLARVQAMADVKTFRRRHPSGLWSGFVGSFGAKLRMCRPSVRRAYLTAAHRFFKEYRPGKKLPWNPGDRKERARTRHP